MFTQATENGSAECIASGGRHEMKGKQLPGDFQLAKESVASFAVHRAR
jgi:hypothetical protein